MASNSILSYANQGAIRNRPLVAELEAQAADAVMSVYGPGYTAKVYSGGQARRGTKGRRTGSVRHDEGKAGDFYILDPKGNRVTGDKLGPLAQYWRAKGYGGVGLEMRGGGIHLDTWEKPPPGGGMHWNYASKGGQYTPGQRQAVAAGNAGQLPELGGKGLGMMALVQPGAGQRAFDAQPSPRPAPGQTPPYVPQQAPTPAQSAIVSVAPSPAAPRPVAAPMPTPAPAGGGMASMLGGPAADTFTPAPAPTPLDAQEPLERRDRARRELMRRKAQAELDRRRGAQPQQSPLGGLPTSPVHTNDFEGFDPNTVPGYNPATGMVEKSRGQSFTSGFNDATTFGTMDEIGAGVITGVDRLRGRGTSYDEALQFTRGQQHQERTDNPGAYIGGALTGGVATGVVTAPLAPVAAANTLGRMRQGATLGAAYGGAYGFGSGEGGATNRLISGGIGAGTGAVLGGALSGAAKAIGTGYNALSGAVSRTYNTLTNPAREAGRRVGNAITLDTKNPAVPVLNAADEASAVVNNQNLLNVDRGGGHTRDLARSAGNTDSDAWAMFNKTGNDRFAAQGERARSFIDRIMGGPVDDVAMQENLKTAARAANKPAYAKAYADGERVVKTPELERLLGSPVIIHAVKSAIKTGKDRAIAEGFGNFNPGVSIADDGRVIFKQPPGPISVSGAGARVSVPSSDGSTFANLQFWDYVKRELDDMAGEAISKNKKTAAATLTSLAQQLRDELDNIVPSYKTARQGAAAFFGQDNALEAGRAFVGQNMRASEAEAALKKMKPAERDAFRIGYAAEVKELAKSRDRSNTIDRLFGSEKMREKHRVALGDQNFKEFEQFVRVENAMDLLRGAMGNSTTARQAEMIKRAGAGGGAGLGAGYLTGSLTIGTLTAAATVAARMTGKALDERVTRHVAQLLLADNPAAIKKAVTLATTSPKGAAAVDAITRALAGGGTVAGTKEITDRFRPAPPRVLGQEARKPLEITVGRPRS